MYGKEGDLAMASSGNGDDSNAILLPQKKKSKRKKNGKGKTKSPAGKGSGGGGEPCLSKSKQKKLKQLQEEKEKKAMLAKSIEILEKYKIREEDRSLLRSSGTIGQVQTMREKRLWAVRLSKASLEVPEDVPPSKRRKNAVAVRHDSEDPVQLHLDHAVSEDASSLDDLGQAEELGSEQPFGCHQMETSKCNRDADFKIKSTSELVSPEARQKENGECFTGDQIKAFQVPCCRDIVKKTKTQDQEQNDLNLHHRDITSNASMKMEKSTDGPIIVPISRPKDIEESRASLPIVMMEQEIMEAINENSVVIICGETGCGKTTQVPQFLYEAGFGSNSYVSRKGIIGITQPRRVAVLATAKRVSFELGLRLGKEVGFQVRHDKMLVEKCSLKFMTDGILLRELQSDFLLRKYSIIILDEAHERSLNTDILIGMLSRIIRLRQKMYLEQQGQTISGVTIKPEDMICQLKLVLMSATLRVEDFISDRRLFHEPPPIIEVPTRQYPVVTHFSKKTDVVNYVGQAYKKVVQIHKKLPPGGILVFVTGQREVEYLCRKLRKTSEELTRSNLKEKGNHGSEAYVMDVEDGSAAIESSSSFDQENDVFNTFEQDQDDPEKDSYSSDSDTESELVADSDDEDLLNFTDPNGTDTVLEFLKEPESLASLKASFDALSGNEPAQDCKEHSSASISAAGCSNKSLFSAGPLHVLPLYARLPASSQLCVFEELREGERLVVVATNVAETSLTIPGIKYVIDTGREKVRNYNHANGIETYDIQWISKASAAQRAGRAGRTGPGHCYRLYSSAAFNNIFSKFSCPQITQIPVDGVVLLMKFMGINKVENFPFPTPPEPEALIEAERCLKALGAIDSEGRLMHIGKAMAQYPMSPRHSCMLLTVIQFMRSQQASDRANLILGYAVAAASALSFPNPFTIDPEKNSGETCKEDQVEKADLQKQEKTWQKKQKALAREARAKFCNPSSDALTISYALQLFELAENPFEFCRKNSLHHKTMDEMSKLRKQLLKLVFSKSGVHEEFSWNHGNFRDVEHAWRISYDKHPLQMNEEEILGRALCAGWADRVAKRVRRVSELSEMDRKARAVQYQACALNEIVFLYRRSSVSQTAPEFLVYTELIHSKRPYMHGITSVKADWLVKCASSLCSFSAPLTDPRPHYDPQTDRVLCWVSPSFGPHLWQLPLHMLPIKDDMCRVSVFACALLEGKVLPCLKHVQAFLAATPSSILRPEAAGQRRVADLVNRMKIGQRIIDSRAVLRDTWKKNPTILYPELLCWFQDKFCGKFEELWSQMHSEVILDSHELFPKRVKKVKKTNKVKKLR